MKFIIFIHENDLPSNINSAEGLLIQVREDAPPNTIYNFGSGVIYLFSLKDRDIDYTTENNRIRLLDIKQESLIGLSTDIRLTGKVHLLATMMGYEEIKLKFTVVGCINLEVNETYNQVITDSINNIKD